MDERRIIVFSCGQNCEKYVALNVSLIKNQDYFNYVHVIVDDASTDKTHKKLKNLQSKKIRLYHNDENHKWIKNAIEYLEPNIQSPEDIIITVDLDDWLAHNKVLSQINSFYHSYDVWMTYSMFKYLTPAMAFGIARDTSSWIPQYTREQMENNEFRESLWSFTHLRTMKAFLWNNIDKNDLKDSAGEYFKYCYDQAVFLPVLEMAGNKHIGFIQDVQYIYNNDNINQVEKTHRQEQEDTAKYIRSKQKYQPLQRN